MRDRLSQLIYNKLSETCGECSSLECTEELTDYLIERGVIVPPCKIGDKCYWINRVSNEIETDIVISIQQYENGLSITTVTVGGKSISTYSLNRFLEIMYVTKEEADAALVNYESTKIEKGGDE